MTFSNVRRMQAVSIALGLGLAFAPAAHAADAAPEPGLVRRLLASHRLAKVDRQIDRVAENVAIWKSNGRSDALSTGELGSAPLRSVIDATHELGRTMSDQKAVSAYRDASDASRDRANGKLRLLRASMNDVSGVHFVGGEMNSMFTSGIHKAGIEGINHFFVATSQQPIHLSAKQVGNVEFGTTLFGLLPKDSPLYRLEVR